MGRRIDLTGRIENGMWDYRALPGLESLVPPVEITPIASVERDGFFASRIVLSTISGTYLEAGSHILSGGPLLDSYGVDHFFRPATIVRLPPLAPKTLIDADMLRAAAPPIDRGDALIIDTGWGRMWNQPGYVLTCPNMKASAVQWVIDREPSIFAVDVPAIEAAWSEDDPDTKGGMLGALFAKGILLLAPLVNLDQVRVTKGQFVALPLSVKGCSGAPARVVFIEPD
jgi:arylformamidase